MKQIVTMFMDSEELSSVIDALDMAIDGANSKDERLLLSHISAKFENIYFDWDTEKRDNTND